MNCKEILLAGMVPAEGKVLHPVQVQKLFFLVDQHVGNLIGGPYFNFTAGDYGPVDFQIYSLLKDLAEEDKAIVQREFLINSCSYRLTVSGQKEGETILSQLPLIAQEHIKKLCKWILPLGFPEIISTIYKNFPEMKVNSVFQ